MKKVVKKIVMLMAVFTTLTLATFIGGCANLDDYKTKIDQLQCEHVMEDGTVTKAATCTAVGEQEKICALCGYVETVALPAQGHKIETIPAVPATCVQEGLSVGVKCGVCDTVLVKQETLPLTEHFIVVDKGYAATCVEDGLTDCEYCAVCNEVFLEPVVIPGGHVVGPYDIPATCSTLGLTGGSYCSRCLEEYDGPEFLPTVHNYDGLTCTLCGAYDTSKVNTSKMLETSISSDEKIAGGFYRIYMNVTEEGHLYWNLKFSSWGDVYIGGDDSGNYLYRYDYDGYPYELGTLSDFSKDFGPVIVVCNGGWVLDESGLTETEFVDIYITPEFHFVNDIIEIHLDEETMFTKRSGVKRLVFDEPDFIDPSLGDNGIFFPGNENSNPDRENQPDNLMFY